MSESEPQHGREWGILLSGHARSTAPAGGRRWRVAASAALTALVIAVPTQADASRRALATRVVEVAPELLQAPMSTFGAPGQPALVYLNRCTGGCVVGVGPNDPVNNSSPILDGPISLSAWMYGDEAWDELVHCVRRGMDPFNVMVVDEDPGHVPHIEAIVAGTNVEARMRDYGGVSPLTCTPLTSSVVFTFANTYGLVDVPWDCAITLQEVGHSWALDHEMLCEDPMTYLTMTPECDQISKPLYVDAEASCGEYEARPCSCTNLPTQNSYAHLRAVLGEKPPTPPDVAIVRPLGGSTVRPGAGVEASVADDLEVTHVEFAVNDEVLAVVDEPPFVFNVPRDLIGKVKIEIRASDNRGSLGSDALAVLVEDWVDTGESCSSNDECESGLCGLDADGAGMCTRECDPEADDCAEGMVCTASKTLNVCWPGSNSEDEGGPESAGCSVGQEGSPAPFAGLFLVLCLGRARRRRETRGARRHVRRIPWSR